MVSRSRRNRRKPVAPWARLPPPRQLADVCGRALRRALPAVAAVAIALGAVGGLGLAYRFITSSPRFAIQSIAVRGAHSLDDASVRARVTAEGGDNIFSIDTGAVAGAVAADPWIARAEVHRELPHTLVVDVVEEEAVAMVEIGGLYLTGRDGRVFKRAAIERGEGDGLPVVTGIGRTMYLADPDGAQALIRRALAAAAVWTRAGRPPVGEVHLDAHRGLTLYTRDGAVAVRLGDASGHDLAARLGTFDAAWAALDPDERRRARAVHVDNRTRPDHVTVSFVN